MDHRAGPQPLGKPPTAEKIAKNEFRSGKSRAMSGPTLIRIVERRANRRVCFWDRSGPKI
jgi:hypothetical protein